MVFNVVPTVDEIVADLQSEGINVDAETARRFWDRAQVRMLADGPRAGQSTARSEALVRRMGADFVGQAFDNETSISALMEAEDPTDNPRDAAAGVDAFQRAMRTLRVRTASSHDSGARAHTLADLDAAAEASGNAAAGRVLSYELFRRSFIEGQRFGTSRFARDSAARFYASNNPLSEVLNPAFASRVPTVELARQPILNFMIALQTGVPTDVYKHVYIEDQPTANRMRRVAEGGEYPTVRLTVTDRENRIYKAGVALEITDEAVRRVAIDELRFHIALVGLQRALDKEEMGYDVLVAGDGNANTAATITDISTIGGTAGTVTARPLFDFLGDFEQSGGYAPTIGIAPLATKSKVRIATFGSANFPLFLGSQRIFAAQAGTGPEEVDMPNLYARSYADTGILLLTDASRNMGMAFEIGGAKQETDRYIKRDVNVIKLSDTVSFWIIDQNATRGLDIES
jgi:hypothetical protein